MNKTPFTSRLHLPLLILAAIIPSGGHAGAECIRRHFEDFTLGNWGKYLCYGILAISIDLLWGYTGLLCLGQALFFTLGGYMMGMHLMRMIGGEGMPTFLSMVGRTEWPSFFMPFYQFSVRIADDCSRSRVVGAMFSDFSPFVHESRECISPS